jgi:RNA:NAD 2'-phosphotransferase (TPT1/KptA family)
MRYPLYHWTSTDNLGSILEYGLRPNGMGIIYLTPVPTEAKFGDILLQVDTGDLKLTSFEDCSSWEVLCWGSIPPERIRICQRT